MHGKVRMKFPILFVAALGLALAAGATPASPTTPVATGAARYLDLLDMHGSPKSPTDRSFNIFFDAGSWHGYSLPPETDPTTGFIGPFVQNLKKGRWTGRHVAGVSLVEAGSGRTITLKPVASHYAPGYLARRFSARGLTLREILFLSMTGMPACASS